MKTVKNSFLAIVSMLLLARDLSRWLTPLLASPNATFRVTKHDLLRRNQWLNTYFHPLSIPS